ncbi:hypothetical protein JHS3_19160 [Jeongeupia sp. HS-3]|nr:hypothetical protein JHS3_19160 [Jeongeupia sp. HS-3]
MPLAVAVPWAAGAATATLVAAPPDRFKVIGLLLRANAGADRAGGSPSPAPRCRQRWSRDR